MLTAFILLGAVHGADAIPIADTIPYEPAEASAKLYSEDMARVVKGLIVESAGDYDSLTGLRAPGGRIRPALAALERAVAAMAETATQ